MGFCVVFYSLFFVRIAIAVSFRSAHILLMPSTIVSCRLARTFITEPDTLPLELDFRYFNWEEEEGKKNIASSQKST